MRIALYKCSDYLQITMCSKILRFVSWKTELFISKKKKYTTLHIQIK